MTDTRDEEGGTALVVGYDRSPASQAAFIKAAEIGAKLDAELYVVHAVDLGDYPVDPDADDWEERAGESLVEESERVARILAGYPCGWSYRVLRAEPAEALYTVAEEVRAAMVVVGARSDGWRHRLERLSGPSVSQRLIHHCRRPVLVVTHHPS